MRLKYKIYYNGALKIYYRRNRDKLLKKYIYPYVKDCSEASKRIECWCNFSYECEIINNIKINQISINNSGLSVELHQSLIKRIPHQRGKKQNSFLKELNIALNCAWEKNLVHGDLNRKNILLTEEGYRIVDIEPLLRVPLHNGEFALRTTSPYLAHEDRENWNITKASDKLGFNCFHSWVREEVEYPAQAILKRI